MIDPLIIAEVEGPPEEEPDLPSYSEPGRILFQICPWGEVIGYDYDGSAFWISEGEGIDYWVEQHVDLELPGYYVVEGIVGDYIRGEWGFTDDVRWDFESCRRATEEEIRTEALS